MTVRRVTPAERRARLATRHAVHPAYRLRRVEDAADAVVALHGTDPAGTYLSALARVATLTPEDVDAALYDRRSLVKHMAMRRTLWVMTPDRVAVTRAVAGDRVARSERTALLRMVTGAGLHDEPEGWLDRAERETLDALADGRERTLDELRADVPGLTGRVEQGVGKSWHGFVPLGPRVLTVLAAEGHVVRGSRQGHWRSPVHRWSSMPAWLGAGLADVPAEEAEATLVRWWLHAFGPGTEADVRWWLGSTLTVVRRALAAVSAVEVDLDGSTGYLLPDDLDEVEAVEPWAALLPVLNPSVMGWQQREWYVGPHAARVFDSVGNAGPTVWWDGRVVGIWLQDEHGVVRLELLEDVGRDAQRLLALEAERLQDFCGGVRVTPARW